MKTLIPLLILIISSCHKPKTRVIQNLPEAVTNNAVALVMNKNINEIYSFNGLSQNKTAKDINKTGYRYKNNAWSPIKMPKNAKPVLASTAVSIGTDVYLIGGYTVDDKGDEKSIAEIFVLNTLTDKWSTATKMPIPVDDTVALVYANRYIYLISGWYDVDNVSDVQVYDSIDDIWFKATDFPAPAVFGHAGGIVGNQIIVCDGVKVVVKEKTRDFVSSPVCFKGIINKNNPEIIDWTEVEHHSSVAYYRMAAVGDISKNTIIFAGGSNNPYNYDGIGYNGVKSKASSLVFSYDFNTESWKEYSGLTPENMDHRALLHDGEWFYIIGGMAANQQVSDKIIKFKLIKSK